MRNRIHQPTTGVAKTRRSRNSTATRPPARSLGLLLATMLVTLASCSEGSLEPRDDPQAEQSSTPSTSTTEPESATSSTNRDSVTSTTELARAVSEWPGRGPSRYAVVDDNGVIVVEGEDRYALSDLPDSPTAGGFVGEALVFSVGCCDGIWIWDYQSSDIAERAVGGNGTRTILHGVASHRSESGFFYTTPSDQPDDVPDVMFYDDAQEQADRFLDTSEQLDQTPEEEKSASVGSIVVTPQRVGVLFAFGDNTWVEWYTHSGQPTESPFPGIEQDGTALELALAPQGDVLAVGREERLHQGISTVEVTGLDGDHRSYSVPDVQSLRQLQFDGNYLTASTHRNDQADSPSAQLILDLENNHFSYSTDPRVIALGE